MEPVKRIREISLQYVPFVRQFLAYLLTYPQGFAQLLPEEGAWLLDT